MDGAIEAARGFTTVLFGVGVNMPEIFALRFGVWEDLPWYLTTDEF